MRWTSPFLFVLLCCAGGNLAALAEEPKPSSKPMPSATGSKEAAAQGERDASFEKLLSGATLVGHFTVTGEKTIGAPKEEKYTIAKVSKVQGDIWLFQVRIQYGDHDATLPLPLPVKWAGDTPMIYLDNMPIPGMGTFSARVLFAEGKYAGTWSGKDHGGHLYGRIVPAAATQPADAEKKPVEEEKK